MDKSKKVTEYIKGHSTEVFVGFLFFFTFLIVGGIIWANEAKPVWYIVATFIAPVVLAVLSGKAIGRLRRGDEKGAVIDNPGEASMPLQTTSPAPPAMPSLSHYEQRGKVIETKYDLSCISGINSIPPSAGVLHITSSGFHDYKTDIDYILRKKGFAYEQEGKIELAIACLRKSNELRMFARKGYGITDYYSLVYMLASNGYKDEAEREKEKIDDFFRSLDFQANDSCLCDAKTIVSRVKKEAREFETDLVIMNTHHASCPECAKYQGRVFSLSGKDPLFPPMPKEFWKYGGIHPGCGHAFFPFIYGVSSDDLRDTLELYQTIPPMYSRDIVAFSNRPFVDDRSSDDIQRWIEHNEKRRKELEDQRIAREQMIENAHFHFQEKQKYKLILDNLPELAPKSYPGFRRMKVNNTPNYQKILAAAQEKGIDIE